jgi:aspartate racemase
MEMDFFTKKLKEYNIDSFVPEQKADRDFIQQTLREELGRGVIREETKKAYISIINDMIAKGAEGIILGCTEIPMIISQEDVSVPVFDTTKIHSNAAVAFAVSK